MKIFINAGHGGKDPGAVSKKGTQEKIVTREVSSLLAAKLIQNGFNVEFFQQEKALTEITKTEKTSNSDLFISIHCNAATNKTANGVEVLYYPSSIKGIKCATLVQNKLVELTGLKDRSIKARTDLHVLKSTKAPAILVELAFLTNEKEEKLLIEKPEIFANAILEGIKKFMI